ncbi:endolytic transglycosylase MltG [Pseudoprimorskyibacter insulae]|uniref:Endolytic murein transglycosylase n=1 Tax=Pseudoprimorskyibacter insulae TaxID=1695997 RepID=A0A2R8AXV7_9RHOB|nr:endolytic transglycosylase MltG [Pseudoprimorskyibacter insulae]SPF80840.1 Endolytic murein transglycosylase [Pseudoprimorskyibacter insulae]
MWRHIASNALTFLVVLVFLFGGALIWAKNQYTGQGPLTGAICVKVERGTNFRKVSNDLADQGAVSNGAIFRVGADYAGKTQDLKAGSYLVPEGASMADIVDIVTRGGASTCGTEVVYRIGINRASIQVRELDPATERFVEKAEFVPGVDEVPEDYTRVRSQNDTRYRIALAEGVTSWHVVDGLKAVDVLTGTADAIPAEGSLAPDSYEVRVGDTVASVLDRMQSSQERILSEAWANRVDGLPLQTPDEALILASIIEKETGVAEERRQVASVFVNRLERGMRLQTDPTVIYGITKGEGVLGRGLRQSELRRETPWNTYVIDGLPPTPIANPGKASIEAALDPANTNYVFFVADGTGGHAFAETLAEHNANVAKWRKIEADQGN